MTPFARLLRDYFAHFLPAERGASHRTVEAYRDTMRLVLSWLEKERRLRASNVDFCHLDAPTVSAFLDCLERERGNSPRTRNARLAAIHSFLHFASSRHAEVLPTIQGVLTIPQKRHDRPLLGYLTQAELKAVLETIDRTSWAGERDYTLLTVAYNTGARVSELTAMRVEDADLTRACTVRFLGKGRKHRQVPLWKSTAALLRAWVGREGLTARAPLFPGRDGKPLTRSSVAKRVALAVENATSRCPSLKGRRVTPHTFRHTTAMHLLQSGVDLATIALWLGHESLGTTHSYVEADLKMKEAALGRLPDMGGAVRRFRATDELLHFLEGL
jgi:integrase/recombinase XerD